jgi:type II secretory pathway pseudopilin PulG
MTNSGAKQYDVRSQRGESLISLLVSIVISAIVAAGVMGLAYLNSSSNIRVMNKCDSVNAARNAIDQIGKSLRSARCVGSMWGSVQPIQVPQVDWDQLTSGTSTNISAINFNVYPSQGNSTGYTDFPAPGDPYYGATPIAGNGQPPGGWSSDPGWAPDSGLTDPGTRWRCSQTCLIVQVPVFDQNGIPLGIPWPTVNPMQNIPVMDTVVYRVMPDTASDAQPGTFMMQKCVFPAPNAPRPAGYIANSAPQTVLRGIIGPYDPDQPGSLRVFQYLSNVDPTAVCFQPTTAQGPTNIASIGGVSVNLEVLRQDAGTINQAALQFKSDIYMRNNVAFTN